MGSRLLILGVTYKRNTDDVRESPALDILKILDSRGAIVAYHDPHVPEIRVDGKTLKSVNLEETLRFMDCVIIVTDHSDVDYPGIVSEARLIIDTRNATKGIRSDKIRKI
jgi:UDP-N-acetyl-D-glucosamine dehydrogenase